MKKQLLVALMALVGAGSAMADVAPTMEVIPFKAAPELLSNGNYMIYLPIEVNNPGYKLGNFQLDVKAPEGMTPVTSKTYTKLDADRQQNGLYWDSDFAEYTEGETNHSISGAKQADGDVRLVIASNTNDIFGGESGVIMTVGVNLGKTYTPGAYEFELNDITTSSSINGSYNLPVYKFTVLIGTDTELANQKALKVLGHVNSQASSLFAGLSLTSVDLTEANVDLNGSIKTQNSNTLYYVAEGAKLDNEFNKVVNGTCAKLVLFDGEDFCAPTAFTATEATYNRYVENEGFYTVVLPFTADDDQHYALVVTEVTGDEVEVEDAYFCDLEPNTPVILYTEWADNIVLTAEGVQIAATPATVESDYLVGAYQGIAAGEITGSYALKTDGSGFGICTETAYVPAFHAYLNAPATAPFLALNFGTEGIKSVSTSANGLTFDLQGRQIERAAKGVNIINGVKVIK